jgi:4-amino-4-deoxychorismate synthase (2-amino-4-deoxychorismate-forming) component I
MAVTGAPSQDYSLETLPPDTDLAALVAAAPERYPFLLQSAASGTPQGRYDLLCLGAGDALGLTADGALSGPHAAGADFLDALDAWAAAEACPRPEGVCGALPFRSGWFLFLAYDLARQVEPTLDLAYAPELPVATAVRVAGGVIRDHQTGRVTAVVEAGHEHLMAQLREDLAAPCAPAPLSLTEISEEDPERYLDAVSRTIRYIEDGDVFQANLSRAWQGRIEGAPVDLYRQLCHANPAPFAGLARLGDRWIISSSPERLVEVRARRIQTRPIAGTRPRADEADVDRAMMDELINHPKERAEHVMLIDLERNDLGRVCEIGTVVVDELMAIESYAHVHHIVSNVRGDLRPEVGPGGVIRAVFPGGTITGCPKVRCMEIIQEMEQRPRAAYTGSFGYLDRCGDLDLNILIRTFELEAGRFTLRAGAGIVADSVPGSELEETRDKARGLLRALGTDAASGRGARG